MKLLIEGKEKEVETEVTLSLQTSIRYPGGVEISLNNSTRLLTVLPNGTIKIAFAPAYGYAHVEYE